MRGALLQPGVSNPEMDKLINAKVETFYRAVIDPGSVQQARKGQVRVHVSLIHSFTDMLMLK